MSWPYFTFLELREVVLVLAGAGAEAAPLIVRRGDDAVAELHRIRRVIVPRDGDRRADGGAAAGRALTLKCAGTGCLRRDIGRILEQARGAADRVGLVVVAADEAGAIRVVEQRRRRGGAGDRIPDEFVAGETVIHAGCRWAHPPSRSSRRPRRAGSRRRSRRRRLCRYRWSADAAGPGRCREIVVARARIALGHQAGAGRVGTRAAGAREAPRVVHPSRRGRRARRGRVVAQRGGRVADVRRRRPAHLRRARASDQRAAHRAADDRPVLLRPVGRRGVAPERLGAQLAVEILRVVGARGLLPRVVVVGDRGRRARRGRRVVLRAVDAAPSAGAGQVLAVRVAGVEDRRAVGPARPVQVVVQQRPVGVAVQRHRTLIPILSRVVTGHIGVTPAATSKDA